MNLEEYQRISQRSTSPENDNHNFYFLGIMAEIGEVAALFQKELQYGRDWTKEQLRDELGDLTWFEVQCARVNKIKLFEPKDTDELAPFGTSPSKRFEFLMMQPPPVHIKAIASLFAKPFGLTMEEIYDANIAKLKLRYGEAKFADPIAPALSLVTP